MIALSLSLSGLARLLELAPDAIGRASDALAGHVLLEVRELPPGWEPPPGTVVLARAERAREIQSHIVR